VAFPPAPSTVSFTDIDNFLQESENPDAFADIYSIFQTGHYLGPITTASGPLGATSLPTAGVGTIHAWACALPRRVFFDGLRVYHDAAATGTYRFGIYTDLNGYPDALVAGSDPGNVVGHAVNHNHDIAVAVGPLDAGLYWLSFKIDVKGAGSWGLYNLGNVAITRRSYRDADFVPVGSIAAIRTAFSVAHGAGAMPANFPAGAAIAGADNVVGPFWKVAA
jgi:hypothetical protein